MWAELTELGVVDAQAATWVDRAVALRDLTEIPQPDPVGLTTTLRPYQLEGFWWLAFLHQHGLGGILADDMGLGKTLQVLALVQHAVLRGRGRGPVPRGRPDERGDRLAPAGGDPRARASGSGSSAGAPTTSPPSRATTTSW